MVRKRTTGPSEGWTRKEKGVDWLEKGGEIWIWLRTRVKTKDPVAKHNPFKEDFRHDLKSQGHQREFFVFSEYEREQENKRKRYPQATI